MANVLESVTWGGPARSLLQRLDSLHAGRPAALFIRHTEHENVTPNLNTLQALLQKTGWLAAFDFGASLPKGRVVRLFPTEYFLTRETAEAIQKGFESVGGAAEIVQVLPLTPRINVQKAQEYTRYLDDEPTLNKFTFQWCSGLIPPSIYMPSNEFARRVADFTNSNLATSPANGLDIYVSHDMWIRVFLFHWLGLPLTSDGVKYLEGFTLQMNPNSMRVCYKDRVIEAKYPYWWSSLRAADEAKVVSLASRRQR